jgi:hypothetical protein
MKLQRLIPALLALTVVLAPQWPGIAFAQRDKPKYSAKTDFAKTGTDFEARPSGKNSMDSGLSRRGADDV